MQTTIHTHTYGRVRIPRGQRLITRMCLDWESSTDNMGTPHGKASVDQESQTLL